MTNSMPTLYLYVTPHAWLGCHPCHTKGSSKREEAYLMIRKTKATWSPKGCVKWPVNTRQFPASTWLLWKPNEPTNWPAVATGNLHQPHWQRSRIVEAAGTTHRASKITSAIHRGIICTWAIYDCFCWCIRMHSSRKGAVVCSALMKELRFSRIQVLCFFLEVKSEFCGVWRSSDFCKFQFSGFCNRLKRELVMLGKEAQREMWLNRCVFLITELNGWEEHKKKVFTLLFSSPEKRFDWTFSLTSSKFSWGAHILLPSGFDKGEASLIRANLRLTSCLLQVSDWEGKERNCCETLIQGIVFSCVTNLLGASRGFETVPLADNPRNLPNSLLNPKVFIPTVIHLLIAISIKSRDRHGQQSIG